nr:hypothetical protein [Halorhabdus amylolytica]
MAGVREPPRPAPPVEVGETHSGDRKRREQRRHEDIGRPHQRPGDLLDHHRPGEGSDVLPEGEQARSM